MTTPQEEQDHWDLRAAMPEMWSEDDPDAGVQFCLDLILPFLRELWQPTLLDLGCGIGRLTHPVQNALPAAWVTGVDISPWALHRAAEGDLSRAGFILGDGRLIPLVEPISGGWSFVMLQHIPADAQVDYLLQVADLLEPGGRFLAQVTAGGEASDWSHPLELTRRLVLGQELWARGVSFAVEDTPRFPTWQLLYMTKADS